MGTTHACDEKQQQNRHQCYHAETRARTPAMCPLEGKTRGKPNNCWRLCATGNVRRKVCVIGKETNFYMHYIYVSFPMYYICVLFASAAYIIYTLHTQTGNNTNYDICMYTLCLSTFQINARTENRSTHNTFFQTFKANTERI